MAIAGIKHKGLRELFENGRSRRIGNQYWRNALRILDHLDAILDLRDCVGVKDFHELKGARAGTYSMHVSGNQCNTFRWQDGDVVDVTFEDYH